MHAIKQGFLLPLSVALGVVAFGTRNATAQQLMNQELADLEGRILTISRLVYAPGQSATPHRHPAHLAAYVVSGYVESALDDQPPVRYGPGDVWYEAPLQLHSTFRNPSATDSVTVIVFGLRPPDASNAVPDPNARNR